MTDIKYLAAFVELLNTLVFEGRVEIITTHRVDFLDRWIEATRSGGKLNYSLVPLPSPRQAACTDIVRKPAELAGLELEEGLADIILQDAGSEAGALPLMAFALSELYRMGCPAVRLTCSAYERMGGLRGAISSRAGSIVQELPKETRDALPQLFQLLVYVDTEGRPSRRRVGNAEWGTNETLKQLVDHLVAARFLHTSEREGGSTLEFAHEVLLEAWQTLKEWLNQNQELLSIKTNLLHANERWERGGRDSGDLLAGKRLAQSVDLINHRPDIVSAEVEHFVTTSLARSQVDNQLRERWIVDKIRAAEQQRTSGDCVAALQSALEAADAADSNPSVSEEALAADAQTSLYQTLSYVYPRLVYHAGDAGTGWGRQGATEHSHTGPVRAFALSFDGGRLASGSDDGTVRIWEAGSGERLHALGVHKEAVNAVSIDRRYLLSVSEDRTAMVLSLADRRPCATLNGHRRGVTCGALDPRGRQVATASDDGTVRLWKVPSGEPIRALSHGGFPILSVAISSDGAELMSASSDGSVRTWHPYSGTADGRTERTKFSILRLISANAEPILAAIFLCTLVMEAYTTYWFVDNDIFYWLSEPGSDDVRRTETAWLVVVGSAMISILTNVILGTYPVSVVVEYRQRENISWVKAFLLLISPCSSYVPMRKLMMRLRLRSWRLVKMAWWVASQIGRRTKNAALHVNFSSDGKRRIACYDDGLMRLWNEREELVASLDGHQDAVVYATFSNDGKYIVSASYDGTGRIWDGLSGQSLSVLDGHEERLNHAGFSSDSRFVVTASDDATVRLWDVRTGRCLETLHTDGVPVNWAAFSRSLNGVFIGCNDGSVRAWRVFATREGLMEEAQSVLEWIRAGRCSISEDDNEVLETLVEGMTW